MLSLCCSRSAQGLRNRYILRLAGRPRLFHGSQHPDDSTHGYLSRVGWDTIRHVARKTPTCVKLPDRGVLSVAGPGVGVFLDGLVSAKMPDDAAREHLYSVFLNAKGKVLYDAFLYSNPTSSEEPGYLVEYDARPSDAQPLLHMLKRHLLRSKIKIRDVSHEYDVWAMWNPSQLTYGLDAEAKSWACHPTGVIEPVFGDGGEARWGRQPRTFVDRRAVGLGLRVLASKGHKPRQISLAFDEGTPEDYRVHRYLNGVPEGNDDMPPTHAFPVNSSMDLMGALAFKKGCHVGQEHLSRARHVNALRRRLFPVVVHPEHASVDEVWKSPQPSFPANVAVTTRWLKEPEENQPAARVKNTLVSHARGVGLAMLRTEDVETWEDGHCVLEFEVGGGRDRWRVSPSKPVWWPDLSEERGEKGKNGAENVKVHSLDELLLLHSLSR